MTEKITMELQLGLQEKHSPKSICFGCGPANSHGLKIRSIPQGNEVVAEWTPSSYHEAFPNVLNGGIIGVLLDCHSNWTAAWHLMNESKAPEPPCTVTAEYTIKLKRPCPSKGSLQLKARVVESSADRATVEAELSQNDIVYATCRGLFVAVKAGHPAYHRW